jgi:rRNA maturation RNase YbeY
MNSIAGRAMREVVVNNRQRAVRLDPVRLQAMGVWLLRRCPEWGDYDLGVRLVGRREMAELNWRHLRHEGSTDVITFDYSEAVASASLAEEGGMRGELVICPDEACRQAARFGTTWEAEVARYLIHGILHLLHYDDLEPAARRRMKRVEDQWVKALARQFRFASLAKAV